MKELETWIEIEAPITRVWEMLTDLPNYSAWNPFIRSARGRCELGERLRIQMHIPGKGIQRYAVRITELVKPTTFAWVGHFHLPYLIDGQHRFELSSSSPGMVRVRHAEQFSGLLVPFVWHGFICRYLQPSFVLLNGNLRALCEGRALPHPLAAP